jgi:hypothetical protein
VSDVLSLHGLAGRNLLGLNLWPDTHYMHNLFGSALSNYTPADLFLAGEQGAWYDPSDMSTLFQDAAGTTPVTAVEQFVGLMLDKSKGLVLGPELVTNGDFSNGTTGWSSIVGTHSVVSGKLRCTSSGANIAFDAAPVPTTVGKTYRLTVDAFAGTGTSRVIVGPSPGNGSNFSEAAGSAQASRTLVCTFVATDATTFVSTIQSTAIDGLYAEFDNISVRELPGNHASQPTSTARPRLSARVNLLTKTEDFADGVWVKTNATVTPNAAIAPDGTVSADKLVTSSAGNQLTYQNASWILDSTYTLSFYVKAAEITTFDVTDVVWRDGSLVVFDLTNQVATINFATTSPATAASIVSVGNGWFRCSVTAKALATSSSSSGWARIRIGASTSIGWGLFIWGADLRVANTGVGLPPYQRVNTSTDYDTVGYPKYLVFDGVDDFMSTGNINFTGTDKMTVWAGVRKLSDVNRAMVVELSSVYSLPGTFGLNAPGAAPSDSYVFGSTGSSVFEARAFGLIAPITNVLTAIGDISGDRAILRVNGTQIAIGTGDQGTGNYGNYPMFIGSRAGTSARFNGHLYSLIIRGAQTNAAQLANTDSWVNTRTGAY